MAEISAQLVKTTTRNDRRRHDGMQKGAWQADGDLSKAVEVLRTRGIGGASKKEGRSTKQGVLGVKIAADGKSGVLVEVNCESDFVARTEDFQALVRRHYGAYRGAEADHVRQEEVAQARFRSSRAVRAEILQRTEPDRQRTDQSENRQARREHHGLALCDSFCAKQRRGGVVCSHGRASGEHCQTAQRG